MDQQELVVPNEEVDINGFLSALKVITGHDTALDAVPLETVLAAIPRVDRVKAPSGTPVLVRIDLDMPIERGKVADMSRIQANSPTIEFCSKNGWKTVMFGHLGRQPSVTVAPVCEAMSAHLGRPIRLVSDWIDEERNCLLDGFLDMVRHAPAGCVFMLENTRKYSIEQGLWDVDASSFDAMSHRMYALASDIRERLAKIEINEAIAASNTDFSSSVLPLLMSHTAMGFHLEYPRCSYGQCCCF